ncbi:ABC transporter ATP-binding protein [Prauserella flavalba]|uniref:Multidrug ABC transporter ATP-binding protein n=1 Tax=Prauserella flavalba TaxID=1477506 RepID=A0A318LQQ1_9PSEU|nr:ABC transporter ATP-binding protein [Prauserella flavalba]PXY35880.1 multidrug ABC transporter ATP-binding protein [Prauserella flavalba]
MAVIEIDGVRKRYGATVAADDVSLTVERGEIFGLLGPNGAGKTTLVECVAGLRTPDAGRIRVLGLDPLRDRTRLRQVLGVQLQQGHLPEALRVGEVVTLYRSFYRDGADPRRLVADLGLAEQWESPFGKLSGGQAQRLSIALALVGRPRVAVLDELSTGLDPRGRRNIWEIVERIRDTGVTVVLVSHLLEEVHRLCDRVAVLDRGRVVALDTPDGLVAREGGGQRIRLRVGEPLEAAVLEALPGVTGVREDDGEFLLSGTDEMLPAVTAELARRSVTVTALRLEEATLDDAYLAITGRTTEENPDD